MFITLVVHQLQLHVCIILNHSAFKHLLSFSVKNFIEEVISRQCHSAHLKEKCFLANSLQKSSLRFDGVSDSMLCINLKNACERRVENVLQADTLVLRICENKAFVIVSNETSSAWKRKFLEKIALKFFLKLTV